MPVSTAQPNSAATSSGTASSARRTADSRATTARSANAETPRWWWIGPDASAYTPGPCSRSPEPLAAAAAEHSAGRPRVQLRHVPQLGTNTSTTRSPTPRSVTPAPSAVTRPTASWPSAIGSGRTRVPSTTDRSEWHRLE